jgi:hypothetical protein
MELAVVLVVATVLVVLLYRRYEPALDFAYTPDSVWLVLWYNSGGSRSNRKYRKILEFQRDFLDDGN